MRQPARNILVALSLAIAASAGVAPAAAEEASEKGRRLLDVEAAVGAIIAAESDAPVDDNVLYGASIAVRIVDRVDGELGFLVGDTKDSDDGDSRLVKYLYGGFRYYPYFDIAGIARPYILAGVTQFWDLEDDESDTGLIFGPGVRFQPGESFGFTIKYPITVAVTGGGDSSTMMLPNFNLYWEFDLPAATSAGE
jgi:hypothetical protein